MIQLQKIWQQLCSNHTSDRKLILKLWDEIETQYTGKNRYYHTLEHLKFMMDLALQFRDEISDWDTLRFSVFYHDIIYKARRKDNEEKSAQIAQIRLHQLKVPSFKIAACASQILATKHHQTDGSTDTEFFLDLDIAILGAPHELYRRYAQQIRKEYAIFPNLVYRFGRKKVLQHYLNRNYIFLTKKFREAFEVQAKLNLRTELEGL